MGGLAWPLKLFTCGDFLTRVGQRKSALKDNKNNNKFREKKVTFFNIRTLHNNNNNNNNNKQAV
jgi:hypothetical protein